jgi:predicted RNase H-like nuclease (RuvC/YqgF family)
MIPFLLPCLYPKDYQAKRVGDAAVINLSSLNESTKEKEKKQQRHKSRPLKKLIVHPKVKQQKINPRL